MVLKGVFVQYKFSLPKPLNLSSYGYQKLFRALYGYTQSVYKANKKKYTYFRPGVLFFSPHLRTEKNSVLIEKGELQSLIAFFKNGENPTHKWVKRGDWKATYYLDDRMVKPADAVASLEELLARYYIKKKNKNLSLFDELKNVSPSTESEYVKLLVSEAKTIVSREWFNEVYSLSNKLKEFKKAYQTAISFSK